MAQILNPCLVCSKLPIIIPFKDGDKFIAYIFVCACNITAGRHTHMTYSNVFIIGNAYIRPKNYQAHNTEFIIVKGLYNRNNKNININTAIRKWNVHTYNKLNPVIPVNYLIDKINKKDVTCRYCGKPGLSWGLSNSYIRRNNNKAKWCVMERRATKYGGDVFQQHTCKQGREFYHKMKYGK